MLKFVQFYYSVGLYVVFNLNARYGFFFRLKKINRGEPATLC